MDYLPCCGRQHEPEHGQERPLQSLPEGNSNNKITSQEKQNEFFQAIQNMDVERIQHFADKGFKMKSAKQFLNKKEAFHFLAEIEDDAITSEADFNRIFKILFDAGCQVNGTDMFGNTPLMLAAEKGNTKALKWLIDKGAETSMTNQGGNGPLHWASKNGKKEAVRLLLEYKANVNIQNKDHQTPLHLAVIHAKKKVVALLISQGADINLKDCKNEWTPLQYAQSKEIKKLFKQPTDPRTFTKKSRFPSKYVEDVVADSGSGELCREVEVYFGGLDLRNIGASEAASKVTDLLQLDAYKHSVIDPPFDIMVKCRRLCSYLKQHSRQDIIDELKTALLPICGMTGPRRDENVLFKDIKTQETQPLTRALCGDDKWKMMAERLGIPNQQLAYYDRRDDPADVILREEGRFITVGRLYDVLVKCGAAALADEYL